MTPDALLAVALTLALVEIWLLLVWRDARREARRVAMEGRQ